MIERYENETDSEWEERLAEEIIIADNLDGSVNHFIETVAGSETEVTINYIQKDMWVWREHPEGNFHVDTILAWKNKAFLWDELCSLSGKLESVGDLIEWLVEHAIHDSSNTSKIGEQE